MSIIVQIEQLIIDEDVLGRERPAALRAMVEQELARQLRTPGTASALRGIGAVVALPAVALVPAAGSLGLRIAQSVAGGLGTGTPP